MNIEELEFVEGGRFADAIPALRACSGLSLPSNVPVGALHEVVEALRGAVDCWSTVYASDMDEIGSKSCCGVVSYEPHALNCPIRKAKEALSHLSEKGETKE